MALLFTMCSVSVALSVKAGLDTHPASSNRHNKRWDCAVEIKSWERGLKHRTATCW